MMGEIQVRDAVTSPGVGQRMVFSVAGRDGGVSGCRINSWPAVKVWQDFDQDGVTDEGELQTLESLGISRVNLTYDDGTAFSDKSVDVTV